MMKAIVKREAQKGLWLEERPIPQIGVNDLLIKIRKTSICGTDLHLYKWDAWAQSRLPVPYIIGHEFVGEVVGIGKNVSGFSIGDRVSGEGHLTCGNCYHCRIGERVLCPNTIGLGYDATGCFAEYFTLPAQNAFPIPDSIPDELASIFDPLGNTVYTALSCDLVGKDVLIAGAGPIGLMAIAVAKKAGARHVVITDINDYRLDMARKMGASKVVDVRSEKIENAMMQLGIEGGFAACFEMSGSAQAFSSLPTYALNGGTILLLGIVPAEVSIDWHAIIFKQLTIKGLWGRQIFKTWYQMVHMLESGLDVSSIITHTFPAEEFQKGFDIMLSGNSGKVLLDWTYLHS